MSNYYDFDVNKCWYKDVCNKCNSLECYRGCIRYIEMSNLLQNSLIPKNKQHPLLLSPEPQDLQAFEVLNDFKNNIKENVEKGENLYLFSNTVGNGKTTWTIKIMLKYFDSIWAGNGLRERAYFIHTPTFLNQLKNSIGNKDEQIEHLKNKLLEVDLVVWDDIASTKLSEYDHSLLLTYIDQRVLKGLSNIYTGNLNREELNEAIGSRLSSRVYDCSTVVELKGMNRRGTNGKFTDIK